MPKKRQTSKKVVKKASPAQYNGNAKSTKKVKKQPGLIYDEEGKITSGWNARTLKERMHYCHAVMNVMEMDDNKISLIEAIDVMNGVKSNKEGKGHYDRNTFYKYLNEQSELYNRYAQIRENRRKTIIDISESILLKAVKVEDRLVDKVKELGDIMPPVRIENARYALNRLDKNYKEKIENKNINVGFKDLTPEEIEEVEGVSL